MQSNGLVDVNSLIESPPPQSTGKSVDVSSLIEEPQKKNLGGNDLSNGVSHTESQLPSQEEPKFNPDNNFGLPSARQMQQQNIAPSESTVALQPKEALQAQYNKEHIPEWNKEKADYRAKVIKATPDAIKNTAIKSLKLKGINPNNSALLNKEIQHYKNQVDDGDATVSFDKNGNAGLVKNEGFWRSLWNTTKDNVNEWLDARSFKNMNLDERVNYANNKAKEAASEYLKTKPTDAGSVGELIGNTAPTIGRYMAGAAVGAGLEAIAPETGFASNLALKPVMSFAFNEGVDANTSGMNGVLNRYYTLKQHNINNLSDKELMKEAQKGEDVDRLAGIGTSALFSTVGGENGGSVTGKILNKIASLPETAVKKEAEGTLIKTGKDLVEGGLGLGEKTAVVEAAKDIGHNAEGVTNKSSSDIIKDVAKVYGENAAMGIVLDAGMKVITGISKVPPLIKSTLKYDIVKNTTPEQVQGVLQKAVNENAITPEQAQTAETKLNEFGNALKTVPDFLPDEAKASVAGLVLKRENIVKQSEGLDKTAKELIKPQIESIDNQIKEIYRTGKPLQSEIDPTTGTTYEKPTYDATQKERVQNVAEKIAKGKKIDDPEDLQAQEQFPDELNNELEKIKKSETPKEDEVQSDAFKNVNKYLKQNEKENQVPQPETQTSPTNEGANQTEQPTEIEKENLAEQQPVPSKEPIAEPKDINTTDYRGEHQIVTPLTTADNLEGGGSGFEWKFSAQDWEGQHYKESLAKLKSIKDKPDAEVTIYRAVPKGVKDINEGDWISLSKTYAKEHGMHETDASKDMPVISKKVKAKDIGWDGNDLNEFVYNPKAEQQPISKEPVGEKPNEVFYTGRGKKYEDLKTTKGDFIFFSKNPKIAEWHGGDESNVTKANLDTSNFLDLTTQEKKAAFVRDNFTDKDIQELYPNLSRRAFDDRDVRKNTEQKLKELTDEYRKRLEENRFSADGKEQQFLLKKIKEKGYSGVKLLDYHFGELDISHVVLDKSVISQPKDKGLIFENGRVIKDGEDVGEGKFTKHKNGDIEIDKLYLNKENQKKGIGKSVIKKLFNDNPDSDKIIVYPSPPSEPYWGRFADKVRKDGYFEITRNSFEQTTEPISKEENNNEQHREKLMDMLYNMKDSKFGERIDAVISQKEREKGVDDLRNGKDSAAARKVKNLVDGIIKEGSIPFIRGRGGQTERFDVPMQDWFKEPLDEKEVDAAEKLDDATAQIINDEGINLKNLHNLKHLFNGFPYTEEDYNKIGSYLSRQSESNAKSENAAKESNQKINIETKNNENATDIRSNTGQSGSEGDAGSGSKNESSENIQLDEKNTSKSSETKQQAGAEQPPINEEKAKDQGKEEKKLAYSEYPPTSLSYRGTGKLETEFDINRREKTVTKHDLETIKEADNLLDNGWDVNKVLNKMDSEGYIPNDAEYINLTRYGAELAGRLRELKGDPTSEKYGKTLNELNRLANLVNEYHGKAAGRSLGIRARYKTVPDGTYADYMLNELAANNDIPLTDKQKEVANADYTKFEEARNQFEKDKQAFEDEVARFKAEKELEKNKKTSPRKSRKSHEDFVKERKDILEHAREQLRKARGETSSTIIPYANELIAIAPDVAKMVKSLAEEGIYKLEDVVKNIHDTFKDEIKGLQEKDIRDIIAGEYNQKKITKKEAAIRVENLRIEAQLLNKLDRLLKGEEPKNEKAKIRRNKEIYDLRNKITDFRKEEREANKFYGESDAGNRRIEQLEDELDRLKKRIPKEKKEKVEKELLPKEKELKEQIAEEKKKIKEEEKEVNKFYGEDISDEVKRLQSLIKKNEKETAAIKEKIANKDYAIEEKKTPLLEDRELQKRFPETFRKAQKSRDELIKAKRDITIRRMKQMAENKSDFEKTVEVFSKSLNIPRTLMASMDVSAPLRQAVIGTVAHPKLATEAMRFMFKAAANEKVYNRWLDNIHNNPRWEIAEKSKLSITDPESLHVKEREEAFQGAPYAEKIPIIGAGVAASERAYVGYLNKLRWDMFYMYMNRFEEQGKTFDNNPELYKKLASFINSSTGRGDMKGIESAAPILNWFLFASRLIASRVNMLGLSDLPNLVVRGANEVVRVATLNKINPQWKLDYGFYQSLPKELRIEAAKDMAKFVATGIATLLIVKGLSNATGGNIEVETDPRSSDFGKIKSGNTRWDVWGGFQPYARVLTQAIMAQRKATTTGKVYELNGKGFMGENRLSPLETFGREKLAPVPSTAVNLISGRNAVGQPVTFGSESLSDVMPLIINDVYNGIQDQGVKALFTVGIPSAFGIGVQTYSKTNNLMKGGDAGGGGGGSKFHPPKFHPPRLKAPH